MRTLALTGLLLLGTVLPAVAEPKAEAKKLFTSGCIKCHQPPDLSLAMDRAWLDQVNRSS